MSFQSGWAGFASSSRRRFLRQPYEGGIMMACGPHVQPQKIMHEIKLILPTRRSSA